MHIVSVTDIAKGYDGHTLFDGVSFGLSSGEHVGIIGANGSGKSTLLQLLTGEEIPDAGQVVFNRSARVAYLPQDPHPDPEASALAIALDVGDQGVAQHEAEAMLDRLGLDPAVPVGKLSGGQRRRVALAKALLPASDLLILDEPTNHLDADTIAWVEDELRGRAQALLMVTHDRYFLERLTDRMLEIDRGHVYWHEGTYSTVLQARALREEQTQAREARRDNLLRKEIAWLQRGPKARTSKPKFRVEQAQALQEQTTLGDPGQLQLGTGRRRLGTQVLEVEDVTVAYDDRTVLNGVSFGVGPGERIGIVGPNGAGKTTLLKVLTDQLDPDAGAVHVGKTVEMGFYAQEARAPASNVSVIDTVTAIAPWIPLANGDHLSAEKLAERFMFDPRLQRAPVANLSGGERRRLALLHLLVAAPNVLVLDEPTNDIDLDTLRILEDHLDGFSGTLIVATHDRYVLDRLTDSLLAIEPSGRVRQHLDWDQYRERSAAAATPATDSGDSASADDNRRRQEDRRRLRALDNRMAKLAAQRDEVMANLAGVGADYQRAAELNADLQAIRTELDEVEEEWLALSVD